MREAALEGKGAPLRPGCEPPLYWTSTGGCVLYVPRTILTLADGGLGFQLWTGAPPVEGSCHDER